MSSEFSLIANTSNTEGVAQTISRLRSEFGVKIGSSTGYTSEIMAKLKVSSQLSLPALSHISCPAPGGCPGIQPGQLRDQRHGDHWQAHPRHDLPQHGQHGHLPGLGRGEG